MPLTSQDNRFGSIDSVPIEDITNKRIPISWDLEFVPTAATRTRPLKTVAGNHRRCATKDALEYHRLTVVNITATDDDIGCRFKMQCSLGLGDKGIYRWDITVSWSTHLWSCLQACVSMLANEPLYDLFLVLRNTA